MTYTKNVTEKKKENKNTTTEKQNVFLEHNVRATWDQRVRVKITRWSAFMSTGSAWPPKLHIPNVDTAPSIHTGMDTAPSIHTGKVNVYRQT